MKTVVALRPHDVFRPDQEYSISEVAAGLWVPRERVVGAVFAGKFDGAVKNEDSPLTKIRGRTLIEWAVRSSVRVRPTLPDGWTAVPKGERYVDLTERELQPADLLYPGRKTTLQLLDSRLCIPWREAYAAIKAGDLRGGYCAADEHTQVDEGCALEWIARHGIRWQVSESAKSAWQRTHPMQEKEQAPIPLSERVADAVSRRAEQQRQRDEVAYTSLLAKSDLSDMDLLALADVAERLGISSEQIDTDRVATGR